MVASGPCADRKLGRSVATWIGHASARRAVDVFEEDTSRWIDYTGVATFQKLLSLSSAKTNTRPLLPVCRRKPSTTTDRVATTTPRLWPSPHFPRSPYEISDPPSSTLS